MGGMVGRSLAARAFAARQAHGMRGERRRRGARWGSALEKRRRRPVRRTHEAETARGRPRTPRDPGFGEGFPRRRRTAGATLTRTVYSPLCLRAGFLFFLALQASFRALTYSRCSSFSLRRVSFITSQSSAFRFASAWVASFYASTRSYDSVYVWDVKIFDFVKSSKGC